MVTSPILAGSAIDVLMFVRASSVDGAADRRGKKLKQIIMEIFQVKVGLKGVESRFRSWDFPSYNRTVFDERRKVSDTAFG